MKLNLIIVLVTSNFLLTSLSFGEDGHDHKNHAEKSDKKKKAAEDSHAHDEHKENDEHDHEADDNHSDHDDHGGGKSIGQGKAILEIDEVKGFRLSKEAIKTLKLKLNTVAGSSFKITKKTLVASKDKQGVYRFRSGYFKFLSAEIIKEYSDGYGVEVKGVEFGDQIVVDGVGLLRVADVYSTDKSEYGHSH